MAVAVLSASWAKEWKKRLDTSQAFALAAKGWSGSLVFAMRPEPDSDARGRAVFLAIEDGRCRRARPAREADVAGSDLVLSASAETWRRLLRGTTDPMVAILSGQIRFERGKWSALVPYTEAARQLLRAASSIEASFSDE